MQVAEELVWRLREYLERAAQRRRFLARRSRLGPTRIPVARGRPSGLRKPAVWTPPRGVMCMLLHGCRYALTAGVSLVGLGLISLSPPRPPADLAAVGSSTAGRSALTDEGGACPAVCFGAFPREITPHGAGRGPIMFRPYVGLDLLCQETGLRIRGNIVYLTLLAPNIRAFRAGTTHHYLPERERAELTRMVQAGVVPRFSLEPISAPHSRGLRVLSDCPDVLQDLAETLAPLGPCTMRVASELNLYDSRWHVPTTSPAALETTRAGFAAVHRVFSRTAPNVAVTFSAFMPNDPTGAMRRRTLGLICRYLPYVSDYVDMFTGTCYPHRPEEVEGLLLYAQVARQYGKPFGIDELGCRDEATFRRVMEALTAGYLGDLRFCNFFDYHVLKPGVDNPWHLKPADRALLRDLKRRGLLADL